MIYDEQGDPVDNPDLTAGYLIDGTHTVHHDAVEGVQEQNHLDVVAEYPDGGMDVRRVIDVPGVKARDAWDEQVPCQIYVLHPPDLPGQGGGTSLEERVDQAEAALIEMAALLTGGEPV